MTGRRWICAVAVVAWMSLSGASAQQPDQATVPVVSVPGSVQTVSPGQASQPAVTVTTVPSPASPQHAPEQIMWALAASYILRYLTNKNWFTFLSSASTKRLKAVWGFSAAFLTAAGVHIAVNGSLFGDGGAGVTISGLSFNVIKDVIFQWASQQGWYDLVVKQSNGGH